MCECKNSLDFSSLKAVKMASNVDLLARGSAKNRINITSFFDVTVSAMEPQKFLSRDGMSVRSENTSTKLLSQSLGFASTNVLKDNCICKRETNQTISKSTNTCWRACVCLLTNNTTNKKESKKKTDLSYLAQKEIGNSLPATSYYYIKMHLAKRETFTMYTLSISFGNNGASACVPKTKTFHLQ